MYTSDVVVTLYSYPNPNPKPNPVYTSNIFLKGNNVV